MSDNVKKHEYADCDGKKCGLGKHAGGGYYVCPHNNLEVQFPHLKIEWDPDNLKKMCEYASHSGIKVLWICKDSPCECHKWPATIGNRTSKNKPTGCPYCSKGKICIHNNLETQFPELKLEWDPNNIKQMCEYPSGSHDIVLWVCQNGKCDCHKWPARIQSRTRKDNPTGCPFCSKNTGRVCEHNNLEINFPELKCEWHHDNPKPMSEYSSGADDKVWWIISKVKCCCHIWPAYIYSRTGSTKAGCPFCDNKKVCIHHNFEIEHPELKIEWHPDNPKSMKDYSSGSNIIVKWICSKNSSHIWPTTVHCRTKKESTNCPYCFISNTYSKAEMNWLISIEEKENIVIQNALSQDGQYKIKGVGRVDGFCQKTNTVYEFNGDFWHGNPSIYDRDGINSATKTSFGELYDKTIKREQKIIDLGYNLVVKWETDIELKVEELDDEC